MNALGVLFGAFSVLPLIFGGTPCPPREDIYPCLCSEVPLAKKARYTLVTCRHVHSTGALETAYRSFRTMDIDRFVMADCFLDVEKLGDQRDQNQKLPQDWWMNLRIRELEIVDSNLSPGFACDVSKPCRNSYQTHISVVNSSFTSSILTVCEVSKTAKLAWMACLGRLRQFEFRRNRLSHVDGTFFPMTMQALQVVNMSHNAIQRVYDDAFKNLPKLMMLDLSHNEISNISANAFGNIARSLTFLDLSYNHLVTIPPRIHDHTPALATLNLQRNLIRNLDEKSWVGLATKDKIRLIDLRENLVHCDCCLAWFNSSLHINTIVLGGCESPEEYVNVQIRRASIQLAKLCNGTDESISA